MPEPWEFSDWVWNSVLCDDLRESLRLRHTKPWARELARKLIADLRVLRSRRRV